MSVLQRKAQVGKQEHQARAMSVPKALRVALAKVADQSFDMALAVIGVAQERWTGDKIESKMEAGKLLLLLDGPKSATGGAVLDAQLVSALVQQQTTGRVTQSVASERKMTATDAALCAPLIDGLFARAHSFLEKPEDCNMLPPYKFGAFTETPRLFGLAMGQPEYHVLRLTIDIAAGTAQSTLIFILPVPQVIPEPVLDETGQESPTKTNTLENSVLQLRAELSAVLCRLRIPLSDISDLSPGDELSIPSEAFDSVEVHSIEGRTIARGAMGQVEGHRALMLSGYVSDGQAHGAADNGDEDLDEEASDYSNLNFPDLEIPASPDMFDADNVGDFSDYPALPDIPDLESADTDGSMDLAEVPDLPDFPELPGEEELGYDLTDLEDAPKLNMA